MKPEQLDKANDIQRQLNELTGIIEGQERARGRGVFTPEYIRDRCRFDTTTACGGSAMIPKQYTNVLYRAYTRANNEVMAHLRKEVKRLETEFNKL